MSTVLIVDDDADICQLVAFKLEQVPEMQRGQGVTLQKYKDGSLADVKCFALADGLTWKLGDKTRTETRLETWLGEQLATNPQLVLAGDFNIAPEDRDVHNPAAWVDQILCSEPERAAFQRFLGLGLKDSFRLFEQAEKKPPPFEKNKANFSRSNSAKRWTTGLSDFRACKPAYVFTWPTSESLSLPFLPSTM